MSRNTLIVVLFAVAVVVGAAVYLHTPGSGDALHSWLSSLHGGR
jgi:hypothetical protein